MAWISLAAVERVNLYYLVCIHTYRQLEWGKMKYGKLFVCLNSRNSFQTIHRLLPKTKRTKSCFMLLLIVCNQIKWTTIILISINEFSVDFIACYGFRVVYLLAFQSNDSGYSVNIWPSLKGYVLWIHTKWSWRATEEAAFRKQNVHTIWGQIFYVRGYAGINLNPVF